LDLSRCEEDTYQKQDLESFSKFLPKTTDKENELGSESENTKSFFDRHKKSR